MRSRPTAAAQAQPLGGAPQRWLSAAGVAGALVLATSAATLLDRYVSLTVLAMVYLVAVVGVAYRGSLGVSAATAVLAVAVLNFFFVPPRGTLSVDAPENLLTLAALLGVALLVSSLSARLRSTAGEAQRRERRARNLQQFAGLLAGLDDERDIVRAGLDTLRSAGIAAPAAALRDADGRLLLIASAAATAQRPDPTAAPSDDRVGPAGAASPPAAHREALDHCSRTGQTLGPGTGRWSDLPAWYLPLGAGDQRLGALAVGAERAAVDAFEHARLVADLLAGALQRSRHAAEALAARADAEAQTLRNALLAALAHDFRTPLASIVGAVSSLHDQHDRLGNADRLRLLALIDDEARHLSAMTDNTLHWARLSAPQPGLRLDWESAEEIVGAVLARLRRRDPMRRIQAEVPAGLPLVRADAVLLGQLLDNLLDNALKYSAGPVELHAAATDGALCIEVLDRGAGIEKAELPRLFDTFFRGAAARGVRGSGLGLAVCRAIALAHSATLSAARRDGGGSRFLLRLPLTDAPPAAPDAPAGEEEATTP